MAFGGRTKDGVVQLGPEAEATTPVGDDVGTKKVDEKPDVGRRRVGKPWLDLVHGDGRTDDHRGYRGALSRPGQRPRQPSGNRPAPAPIGDPRGVVVGRKGINYLDEKRVEGEDPVAQFGGYARESLIREDQMEHVPDILVVSLLDPEFDEVAAFEELIGSHGGLGGMQTQPMLLHPSDWAIDDEIVGAPGVYRQLRRWIESTGHRLGTGGEPVIEPTGAAVVPDAEAVPAS